MSTVDSSCNDCGKDTFVDDKDYFMVKHAVWAQHGVGTGMLCMDCMEKRLGRKLVKADILPCPLTRFNPYTKVLLAGD